MAVIITKADGTQEAFKVEKLRRSLRRAGARQAEVNAVVADVEAILYDGISTQEIYRHAFTLLRENEALAATRYSLRRALFGLGPTGFPFETFIARLFASEGYTTRTGVVLEGRCVAHEIDLAAYRADHSFIAEAKFHSRPNIKSDLQVAMYSYARLLDLTNVPICSEDQCGITEFWLITNTKFTSSAERYARCAGLRLLSWNYPRNDNLHDRIQRSGLYPITVLNSLSRAQSTALIERGAIVCRDLLEQEHLVRHLHLTQRKTESLLAEVRALCGPAASAE